MLQQLRSIAVVGAVAGALSAQPAATGLSVKLADGTLRHLAPSALAALPRVGGEVTFHETPVRFEGTDLRNVLRAAGVSPVDTLRGPQLRRIILFVGADGYGAAIALSDLDPYRIVIVGDRRPSRWVRQVVRLEVVDLR
jgi:hypothetical protein